MGTVVDHSPEYWRLTQELKSWSAKCRRLTEWTNRRHVDLSNGIFEAWQQRNLAVVCEVDQDTGRNRSWVQEKEVWARKDAKDDYRAVVAGGSKAASGRGLAGHAVGRKSNTME